MFNRLKNRPGLQMFYIAFAAWAIIIALLVFFLSSARPALSAVNPQMVLSALLVEEPDVWSVGDMPIPYADWNMSAHLDGWYKLIAYQWALGVYKAHEEKEQRQAQVVKANPPDTTLWYAISATFAAIAAFFGYTEWQHRRNLLRIWRKP